MAKSPNPSFKIWYGLTVHIIHFQISQAKIVQIGLSGKIQANWKPYGKKSKSFI